MAIIWRKPSQTLVSQVIVKKKRVSYYTETIKALDHHRIEDSSFFHLLHELCY